MTKVPINCGPAEEGCTVRLFAVSNTNQKSLYVLARDGQRAMSIACSANHVYDPTPKIADYYGRHVDEVRTPYSAELKLHWKSIEQAMEQRIEGTVHFNGDQMSIGEEVLRAGA